MKIEKKLLQGRNLMNLEKKLLKNRSAEVKRNLMKFFELLQNISS